MRLSRFGILLANVLLAGTASAGDTIELVVALGGSQVVREGEPFDLTIEFRNVGAEPVFLYRSEEIGPRELDVAASRAGATVHATAPSFHHSAGAEDSFLVPLREGRSLLERVVINDAGRLESPLLSLEAGEHTLRVTLNAPEQGSAGQVRWAGRVTSNELKVRVERTGDDVRRQWRDRLATYLKAPASTSTVPPDHLLLIRHYTVARDPEAAPLLWRMFERVSWDLSIVDAIAFQAQCADAARIRGLLDSGAYLNIEDRKFLEEAFRELTHRASCRE